MDHRKILFSLFLIPFMCIATDLKPWFGTEYEVEIRTQLLYQNYDSISIPHRSSFKRNANDGFLTLSAEYPFKRYSGEFEGTAVYTRHQKYAWDNFRITGRYQWLNEFDCDPLTLVTGITLGQAFNRAVNDISSFHHGHIEGETHLSFGQQYGDPNYDRFLFRWWNVLGIGMADKGSAWVRGDAAYEFDFEGVHNLRAFVNTLWGTGGKNLRPHHFHGYGKITHKSVDVGVRYGYNAGFSGTVSIQYARRVYASNFPENANLVLFEYYLPFGTQTPCYY